MRVLALTLTALTLVLVAGIAGAAPSFNGYTGLVLVPTADTLDLDEYNVAAFSEDVDPRTDVFSFQYGVAEGLEVGAARVRAHGGDRETLLMAKYRIRPETDRQAGLAAGLFDPFDEVDATAYVAASKAWGRTLRVFQNDITNIRGTLGFGGGMLDGFFVGASGGLGDRLLLMTELVKTQSTDSYDFNAGARLNVGGGLRLHGAFFDNFTDFGFGASWNHMR